MNSNRRNGKPASCEPCRLNKTKCDHAVPKCERCLQRGIADRCFYHPAPLTKPRDENQQREAPSSVRPAKRRRLSQLVQENLRTSPPQDDEFADAVAAGTYHPGYLGPTSYEASTRAAILPKDDESPIVRDRAGSIASDISDQEMSHQHPLTKSMRTQMVTDILKSFRHYSIIRELIVWYAENCQAGVVPLPLDIQLIDAMQPIVVQYNLTRLTPDPQLVARVLENSSRPLEISSSLQARDLHKVCSGNNLRLEIIGFLLSTAGRSLSFGALPNLFKESTKLKSMSKLIDELLRASTSCTILCSLISPGNDLTTWMLHDNYHLTIMVCGFSSPPTWRRLGELVTTIYAVGLHREPKTTSLPPWLLEVRRRVFCATYMQDKAISTFLGRPMLISQRHTDINIPLDLSDAELLEDETVMNSAIQKLDMNGWTTDRRYLRASWIRLRYISATYREEILDFALAKVDDKVERQLLDISRRIHESWKAIPLHLRYWSTCWDEGIIPSACLMLLVVDQTYWYCEFMIRKLLQTQPLTSNVELLRVSTTLLSNTLTLGTIRDRTYDIHKDFLYQVILFGIPAASVLASALQEQSHAKQPFPPSISRAEVIRMLSVLISHLDAAAHLESSSARPGGPNYTLCRKASKAFTRIVDNVLDPRPNADAPATPASTEKEMELDLNLDLFTAPGLDVFDGVEFLTGDDGIDWGAMAQWEF